jgi:hypothetical protein
MVYILSYLSAGIVAGEMNVLALEELLTEDNCLLGYSAM